MIASSLYAALCGIGFTPTTTLYMMLAVPLLGLAAFLFIKEPNDASSSSLLDDENGENDSNTTEPPPLLSLSDKLHYLPKMSIFFIPMLINCLLEYMASQTVSLVEF